jgi:peptidoglycan/xylan/chitin deacetylase (PgdA/CDA1 family)
VKVKIAIGVCLICLVLSAGCQAAQSSEPELPTSDTKLVSLFFDDGYWNQYQVALPVLLKHDFKATFGVITGSIGKGHGLWEYMDVKELEVLAALGMDIAGHTRTHHDLTENLTDEQLREEIIDSKIYLEQMGFEVSTMIYPYCAWNDRIIEYVTGAGYTCARAGWSEEGAYDLATTDRKSRYHLPSWQITNQDMDKFKQIVNKATGHSVVCLTYHFISDVGPVETSTSLDSFRAQMSYLKEAGFNVVLPPELFSQ